MNRRKHMFFYVTAIKNLGLSFLVVDVLLYYLVTIYTVICSKPSFWQPINDNMLVNILKIFCNYIIRHNSFCLVLNIYTVVHKPE